MRKVITLMLVLLLAACGGGGGQGDSSAPVPGGSSAPTLRFEGVYTGGTLIIHPVADAATIGSNALARVDVLVNDQSALSLAAPSRVDAAGRDEYVFDIPPLAGDAGRLCWAYLPLRVTVTDATGFSFSKYAAVCPSGSLTFSAFSDYGNRDVRITGSSSAPMNARAQRYQEAGTYRDDVLRRLATSLDVVLRSSERDSLTASIGTFGLPPAGAPSVPAGSTMTMRVDAGGGAFAEAASVSASDPLGYGQSADASLACCHAVGDGSAKQVRIIITGTRSGSPATFAYAWRITDPATGTVVSQESATRVGVPTDPYGATLARLEQVLDVRSGQQVEVTATTDAPQTRLDASVFAGATTGLVLGSAAGNRQARVSVFCCFRPDSVEKLAPTARAHVFMGTRPLTRLTIASPGAFYEVGFGRCCAAS